MTMKALSLAVLAALMLAACSDKNPVDSKAGAKIGADASEGNMITRFFSLTSSKSAKAIVTMPASSLIVDAMRITAAESEEIQKAAAENRMMLPAIGVADILQMRSMIQKTGKIEDLATARQAMEKVLPNGGQTFFADFARSSILGAATPQNGWPVNAMRRSPELDVYTQYQLAQALFSNALQTEIAGRLRATVLADPEAAKTAIRNELAKLPPETIQAAWSQALADATGGLSVDLTGSGNVHYVLAAADVTIDGGGVTLKRNGNTWFGGGKLSGQDYQLGLESSISKQTSKSSSADSAQKASAGTGSGADAGVK